MTALQYYRSRYPGESWTPDDIRADVEATCHQAGIPESEPAAVAIWLELERVSEMTGDIPVDEF